MRLSFMCVIIMSIFSISTSAINATVHITVKNFTGAVTVYDPELRYDLTKYAIKLQLNTHQSASYTININKPTYLILYFQSAGHRLFLSPGDELFLTADLRKANDNITVTGKGSNNNNPIVLGLANDMDLQEFKDDPAPNRVITAINKQYLTNKSILANYIKVNKPSAAFIQAQIVNLQYFAPLNYYESSHNNIYGKPKEQLRKWQKIQDSLFSAAKLSNDDALTAYNYTRLIDRFVQVKVGELW